MEKITNINPNYQKEIEINKACDDLCKILPMKKIISGYNLYIYIKDYLLSQFNLPKPKRLLQKEITPILFLAYQFHQTDIVKIKMQKNKLYVHYVCYLTKKQKQKIFTKFIYLNKLFETIKLNKLSQETLDKLYNLFHLQHVIYSKKYFNEKIFNEKEKENLYVTAHLNKIKIVLAIADIANENKTLSIDDKIECYLKAFFLCDIFQDNFPEIKIKTIERKIKTTMQPIQNTKNLEKLMENYSTKMFIISKIIDLYFQKVKNNPNQYEDILSETYQFIEKCRENFQKPVNYKSESVTSAGIGNANIKFGQYQLRCYEHKIKIIYYYHKKINFKSTDKLQLEKEYKNSMKKFLNKHKFLQKIFKRTQEKVKNKNTDIQLKIFNNLKESFKKSLLCTLIEENYQEYCEYFLQKINLKIARYKIKIGDDSNTKKLTIKTPNPNQQLKFYKLFFI